MGDASRVNSDISKVQAVTASDVQRVMKKYFNDTNRVVITYLPEPAKPQASEGEVKKGGVR
jgi:predicted Zn-dependent peptidase